MREIVNAILYQERTGPRTSPGWRWTSRPCSLRLAFRPPQPAWTRKSRGSKRGIATDSLGQLLVALCGVLQVPGHLRDDRQG